jgi:hypothetical protein
MKRTHRKKARTDRPTLPELDHTTVQANRTIHRMQAGPEPGGERSAPLPGRAGLRPKHGPAAVGRCSACQLATPFAENRTLDVAVQFCSI